MVSALSFIQKERKQTNLLQTTRQFEKILQTNGEKLLWINYTKD